VETALFTKISTERAATETVLLTEVATITATTKTDVISETVSVLATATVVESAAPVATTTAFVYPQTLKVRQVESSVSEYATAACADWEKLSRLAVVLESSPSRSPPPPSPRSLL